MGSSRQRRAAYGSTPKERVQIFEHFRSLTHDRIAVLISHRFSTVRYADQIVVLERGRVVERGTPDALVARGGVYAQLERTFHRAGR